MRLAPLEWQLPDDHGKVSLGLATQTRVTVDDTGGKLGEGARDTSATAELRRVRVTLRGSFLDDRLRTLLQLSFAPGNPEVLDLWTEYAARGWLRLRVGQMKTPFTRHRAQSFANLPLVDWDLAATRFGAERQLGVMLHEGLRGDGHLNYAIGLFAGPNARSAFARGIAEAYAERIPNRSSLSAAATPTELHPALVGQLGYTSKNMDGSAPTDLEGGPLRSFVALNAAVDAAPQRAHDFAARFAPEALLKLHHVTLDLVGYGGLFAADGGSWKLGLLGLTAEATYRFHPRFEVAARYSRSDTLRALRRDAQQRAAAVVAGAAEADRAALTSQYTAAGQTRAQQEIALGFNAYVIGRNLAWQTDLALLRVDRLGQSADSDEVRLRSQLQLML